MSKRVKVNTDKPVTPIHVFANEMAELMAIVRPWFIWPPLIIGAVLLRIFWHQNLFVVGFLCLVALMLPVLIWVMDRDKYVPYFVHSVLSGFIIAGTLSYVDLMGYAGHHYTGLFLLLFGLPLLCLTWSIRGAITEKHDASGTHLQDFFETAGFPNTKLRINDPEIPVKEKKVKIKKRHSMRIGDGEPEEITPTAVIPKVETESTGKQRRQKIDRRVKGTIHLDPGMTHEDLVADIRRVESAWRVPPGSITLAQNLDDASWSDAIVSDPRTIRNPIFYPGPSYVGGSIADPLAIATYQDGTECEYVLPHTMLQIMGMINSGKSLGGGWSIIAEAITRTDCVVWAADVTKGFQTLGPLQPALHRVETTPKGTKMMLEDVNSLIKPRTNYLAEKGLGKWQKGCGLNYMIVWLEEIPEIVSDIGKAGKDLWVNSVKAGRSAGITIIWSLQLAHFNQIPTVSRGQGAKMCFGVSDAKDAKFGLTSGQVAAGCTPELWGQRQQGMAYLDAPAIAEDYLAMPLRTWYWGEDDKLIRRHAAQYPIADRPYDDLMVKVLGTATHTPISIGDEPGVVEDLNKGIPDSVVAKTRVRGWLLSHKGETLKVSDILEQAKLAGRERRWMELFLKDLEREQVISRVGLKGRWMVNNDELPVKGMEKDQ